MEKRSKQEQLERNENKRVYIIEQIEKTLPEIALSMGYDNITDIKQSQWKALLFKAGKTLFSNNRYLYNDTLDNNGHYNNIYNFELLLSLTDYFVYLSNQYNKLVSLQGYCMLFNIDDCILYNWLYYNNNNANNINDINIYNINDNSISLEDKERSNYIRIEIFKRLNQNREQSLLDRAGDSKNILGLFQVGRRLYNWDSPLQKSEPLQALSASELPKLTDNTDQ